MLILFGACAGTTASIVCYKPQTVAVVDTLYFGSQHVTGRVSADNWLDFISTTATALFPHGLTHWQAVGQWQTAEGLLIKEDSYVLQLVHNNDADNEHHIDVLIKQYKTQFQQESVLRVKQLACIGF
jgi:hypothetical protein